MLTVCYKASSEQLSVKTPPVGYGPVAAVASTEKRLWISSRSLLSIRATLPALPVSRPVRHSVDVTRGRCATCSWFSKWNLVEKQISSNAAA